MWINRGVLDGLEGQQLGDGLVGDRFGRLTALAQTDEGRGDCSFVLRRKRYRRPLPWTNPARQLDLGVNAVFTQAFDGMIAHSACDVIGEVSDAGDSVQPA